MQKWKTDGPSQGLDEFENEDHDGYLQPIGETRLTRTCFIWSEACPNEYVDTKEQRVAAKKCIPVDHCPHQRMRDLEACVLQSGRYLVKQISVTEKHQRHYYKNPDTGATVAQGYVEELF